MIPKKFNLFEISKQLTKAWSPRDIETVNNYVLRVGKFDGKYHWHKHINQDELFLVFQGEIKIQTKAGEITLKQGEGLKIPRNIEHRPISTRPSIVLMFEPLELKSKGD
jgi:mannose-6-phosphate isomerase-like protein (cupin superfamily)